MTKRFPVAVALALALFMGSACEEKAPEKQSDLAQEMAARQEIKAIKTLLVNDKMADARSRFDIAKARFGHTALWKQENGDNMLAEGGKLSETEKASASGAALIKLQNLVIGFRKETGTWPAPGQIRRPADAWNNDTYWVVGTPNDSYDLLLVSSGPDGKPGSGDELIVVWTEEDIGGYKDKQTGAIVGKRNKTRNPVGGKTGREVKEGKASQVMSIDDLSKIDDAAGFPPEQSVDLDELQASGRAHEQVSQPREGEMVLSIDEIAGALGR